MKLYIFLAITKNIFRLDVFNLQTLILWNAAQVAAMFYFDLNDFSCKQRLQAPRDNAGRLK